MLAGLHMLLACERAAASPFFHRPLGLVKVSDALQSCKAVSAVALMLGPAPRVPYSAVLWGVSLGQVF